MLTTYKRCGCNTYVIREGKRAIGTSLFDAIGGGRIPVWRFRGYWTDPLLLIYVLTVLTRLTRRHRFPLALNRPKH